MVHEESTMIDIEFHLPEGRFLYSTLSGDLKRNNEIAGIQIHPKGASFLFYVVLHKSLPFIQLFWPTRVGLNCAKLSNDVKVLDYR
jgi:hypothetical protein